MDTETTMHIYKDCQYCDVTTSDWQTAFNIERQLRDDGWQTQANIGESHGLTYFHIGATRPLVGYQL